MSIKHTLVHGGKLITNNYAIQAPNGDRIGGASSVYLPALDDECESGIVYSYGVNIDKAERGQGYGKDAHAARLEMWREAGLNYAICIVRRDNEPQLRILNKQGWVRLANTTTGDGSPIYLMGRSLK